MCICHKAVQFDTSQGGDGLMVQDITCLDWYQIILLGDKRHVCEQLASGATRVYSARGQKQCNVFPQMGRGYNKTCTVCHSMKM